jgi:hypothetical protein
VLKSALLIALALAPSLALGADGLRVAKTAGVSDPDLPLKRQMRYETNFRARYLAVPSSILDIWFFDNDDDGANPFARPSVRGYAVGGEFVMKHQPANWIFYFEYVGNLMDEGYWDDVEAPPAHNDGDWVDPEGMGFVVLGANYGHEIYATPWLSFLFGGGLGVGVITGELTHWSPGSADTSDGEPCLSESPAYYRKDYCGPNGSKRVPRVLPMVDLTASSRVHLGDQANLRFDVGLHNMLYMGTAFGAVF